MREIFRKVMIFTLILSVVGVIATISLNTQNDSFNVAGNVFTAANTKHNKTENKEIELSDDFWTSGRFKF